MFTASRYLAAIHVIEKLQLFLLLMHTLRS